MRGRRNGVRREGRSVRGGALIGGVVLACSVLSFSMLNGWGAEPPKGDGHDEQMMMPHQKTMQQGGPVKRRSGLATPKGWRFSIPAGDPEAGRQVFADFECFKCHEVLGEEFPAPQAEQGDVGPALSGMGAMHPAEYFAEVIIDPNATVAWRIKSHEAEKEGFLGPDGTSKMPSYNETMTVQQLIDVVVYMKSLTTGGEHTHQH
ncbi:MAG: c-type cytochrome [Candidatus Methylomirabilis oxyfera]|nr:c-type cytochrome [Candidatus Methylomirabilis oxyfera]